MRGLIGARARGLYLTDLDIFAKDFIEKDKHSVNEAANKYPDKNEPDRERGWLLEILNNEKNQCPRPDNPTNMAPCL